MGRTVEDDDAMGNPVIGLLGGGQLGRMLCEAANPLGIDIAILDGKDAPAKQAHSTGRHVAGSFKDPAKIRELAARSDYLSVEIEHVETDVLEDIEKNGVDIRLANGSTVTHRPPIHPSWRTIRLIQDKYLQKEHFAASASKIPIAAQLAVESGDAGLASLQHAAKEFGFPFMLKARKGSYDGRGNFKVDSDADFAPALAALGKLPLYAEKWAPFVKELAVMVIRTEDDEGHLRNCVAYPAVETVHEDSVCTKVFMPPRDVAEKVCEDARALACNVISTLWGRGVFAVEMFVLEDGSLVVNEVAPRPHNSGHYTIEAVPYMSQYKAQIYAVLDLPIPETLTPRVPSSIMLNILGGAAPDSHHRLARLARSVYSDSMDVYLHLYGKESKPGRKIGHITLTGLSSIEELEKEARPFIKLVDTIRKERLDAVSEQLRPQAEPSIDVSEKKSPETLKSSKSEKKPIRPETGNHVDGPSDKPLVLVTMGSDSDLPVLKAGLDILKDFKVPYALDITSAHRTPKYMMRVADEAAGKGIKVIIAAAGGAAHLPGMLASETPLPVIGVPVKATHLDGMDSLLSIVQMPRGVPTATVGINNSTNAALLAIRILGAFTPRYQEKMRKYQLDMEEAVIEKGNKLRTAGDTEYLVEMKGKSK
ncbi:phosphoribosylaminoimidazole carboxylase [Lasiosphaeria miniovina]|uniref:Phosphoribosylaminoimidazole carboxylase n=1 Tax=Lasiosphaeria miniovina TaxID=1954250 RepID=A0AA40BHQ8_9PEZI|nr:phosphoribosylaminoimidazole carboxylase [Lasiosphaeria miniovina]KAK0734395.1 phosphoribosylaminoimidazole carboxylase [Lasiosphaeria miniovina]